MDTRTIFIIAILGLPAVATFNAFWFGTELKNFVSKTRRLESTRDIERFKVVVGRQMWAALAQIFLLSGPMIIFIVGIFLEILSLSDLPYVVAPAVIILIIAAVFRGWESRAKSLPTASPEIRDQRDAVVRTWLRKPWPDW